MFYANEGITIEFKSTRN